MYNERTCSSARRTRPVIEIYVDEKLECTVILDFGKCDGENITVPAFILPDGTVEILEDEDDLVEDLKNLQLGETISTGGGAFCIFDYKRIK